MRHTALKHVVCRIVCVEVIKEFTEGLERLTRVEDDDPIDEVDIPAVKRPMKCFFGDFGRALDIACVRDTLEFADKLNRVIHVFEDVRTDSVGKCAVFEGQMVCIGNDKRSVNDQITAALGIVKEKAIYQDVGTWVGIFATADFKHKPLLGRVESLFHTA